MTAGPTAWSAEQAALSGGNAFGGINVTAITSCFVIYRWSTLFLYRSESSFIITILGTVSRIYGPRKLQVHGRYKDHKLKGVNSVIPVQRLGSRYRPQGQCFTDKIRYTSICIATESDNHYRSLHFMQKNFLSCSWGTVSKTA